MDKEGTEIIIRKIIRDMGIHETYMNIYDKLMNITKAQMGWRKNNYYI